MSCWKFEICSEEQCGVLSPHGCVVYPPSGIESVCSLSEGRVVFEKLVETGVLGREEQGAFMAVLEGAGVPPYRPLDDVWRGQLVRSCVRNVRAGKGSVGDLVHVLEALYYFSPDDVDQLMVAVDAALLEPDPPPDPKSMWFARALVSVKPLWWSYVLSAMRSGAPDADYDEVLHLARRGLAAFGAMTPEEIAFAVETFNDSPIGEVLKTIDDFLAIGSLNDADANHLRREVMRTHKNMPIVVSGSGSKKDN